MTTPSHVEYLTNANYGKFTVRSARISVPMHKLRPGRGHVRPDVMTDIHISVPWHVLLMNGSCMQHFKWRRTQSTRMWASDSCRGETVLSIRCPNYAYSKEVLVLPTISATISATIPNSILAIPYGWGKIDSKWCFLNDNGSLDWFKTRDNYKSHGKRLNFGFDVGTTMDGEAWQLTGPVKNGRTLRSGKVMETIPDNKEDFEVAQSKINTTHANAVMCLFIKAADFVKEEQQKKKTVSFDPVIKQGVAYQPPLREQASLIKELRATITFLMNRVEDQDEMITQRGKSYDIAQLVIEEQRDLLDMYAEHIGEATPNLDAIKE